MTIQKRVQLKTNNSAKGNSEKEHSGNDKKNTTPKLVILRKDESGKQTMGKGHFREYKSEKGQFCKRHTLKNVNSEKGQF